MVLHQSMGAPSHIQILNLGDGALLVDFLGQSDALIKIHRLCERLFECSPAWLLDATPGIDSLVVSLRYQNNDYSEVRSKAREEICALLKNILSDKKSTFIKDEVQQIRVCYDPELAPDLLECAQKCNLTVRELINRHKDSEIRVDILGFMPGFAYCSGLDPKLKLPRLPSPRTSVPAGSVAIAELQTAIYPKPTPGGWNIIGRTPDILFDPSKPQPNLLSAGVRVQFIEISLEEFKKIQEQQVAKTLKVKSVSSAKVNFIEVITSGSLTTIQGLPRNGFAHLALSSGGAIDQEGALLANALLGNSTDAAGLEITGTGPQLLFHVDTWIAWVGATCPGYIDGKLIPGNRPVYIQKGQSLRFGSMSQGYRIFLAFCGGIESEFILGGQGTHLSADIGGKALHKGDVFYLTDQHSFAEKPLLKSLSKADQVFPRWCIASPASLGGNVQTILAIPSLHMDLLSLKEQEILWNTIWTVSSQSNRMGMRLDSHLSILGTTKGIASQRICFGTVQLPPSGQPIVMMAEHQTTGGYPRLLETIRSERSKLAQLRPGDKMQFVRITLEDADAQNALYFNEQKKTLDTLQAILLTNL